ncbi:hypothetical protein A2771_02630 [Candidatus Woesebacteria bacterium RIFCSPHIGHO2_01_FULL_38_26b]|uniref:Phosphoglycerate mutase n=1 Tax=Candidatus Woesebacteria bacterium RIFCSPHIGHO2_01_FULL_38_26b TaxID=1802491 RepID=A0A1F7XXR9_9BACT|nr:MAG: hypothetical protein A2771_02630 [Candidatus Woesebacteria bacterium RIFCSPHIGHO2_01_FULL_38_26b]
MEEDFVNLIDTEKKDSTSLRRLIVVRHGESVANKQGIYQGQTFDTDLSELGIKQARALAKRLKSSDIIKIITSPLKRTFQTAQTVANEVGCEIEVNEMIIETNHGKWEGKHKDWIKKNFLPIYELWHSKPSEVIFPEGEAFIDTVKRTLNFLENTNFESNSLIVTHDNIIRAMISLISNLDIDKMWEIPLETASVNFIEVNMINRKNLFRVLKLNDLDHLVGLRNNIKFHAL